MPLMRKTLSAAAIASVIATAAHGEVLVCQMTDYKGDGRKSLAQAVVPPRATLVLDNGSALLKETGVTGDLTVLNKIYRVEFEDRMPAPVSGAAKIVWEIDKATGSARVKTAAVRQSPWDDFPERNGIFTVNGRCGKE